jgi:hypothetical protein
MSKQENPKGWIENLRCLLIFENAILLLSVIVATNIGLAQGFATYLPHASWEMLVKQVPIGQAVLFLCAIGFYMTVVANAIRWVFVTLFHRRILDAQEVYRKLNDRDSDDYKRRRRRGYIFPSEVLAIANKDRNSYLFKQYQAHIKQRNEEWTISSHAIACMTLIGIDIWRDHCKAIVPYAFFALRGSITSWPAWLFMGIVSFALVASILYPILSNNDLWMYCPGFLPENEKLPSYSDRPPPPSQ